MLPAGFYQRSVALLLVGVLAACVANVPDDTRLLSISVVDGRDQPELVHRFEPNPWKVRESSPLQLKVQFATELDLSKFAYRHGYSLVNIAYFCDQPEVDVGLSGPAVFQRGRELGLAERANPPRSAASSSDDAPYYFFTHVAVRSIGSASPPGQPVITDFDLRHVPRSICFYLKGGNMVGSGFKSNVVVIPASDITSAIRRRAE